MQSSCPDERPWYDGITRYQWLVLTVASLGWVFDVFEGQIFVASMNEAMLGLVPSGEGRSQVPFYTGITFAAFLLGGAVGGVLFGRLSDRIGRARTMILTILVYSLFTGLTALAQSWWHMAVFRFLVALGTGGEWAVAAALIAEIFPTRSRAWCLAIFHGSSVLGTYLAIVVGAFVVGNPDLGWRYGFLLGTAPALLVLWIRWLVREPGRLGQGLAGTDTAACPAQGSASVPALPAFPSKLADLFRGRLRQRTFVGVSLAAVGLATFWGVHIHGKDVLRRQVEREALAGLSPADEKSRSEELKSSFKDWEMLGMFLVTTGGGIGLVSFGSLADHWGRRGAFLFFHLGAVLASVILFQLISGLVAILLFLPIFGFMTLGMHAGYAVYFPELFPGSLRGAGAGFCFNMGRLLAAPVLLLSGWLQSENLALEDAATLLSLLFLLGLVLLPLAPETRGRDLEA